MSEISIVLVSTAAAFCALIIFMIVRTALHKPHLIETRSFEPIKVDKERIAQKLSEAVQIPTVTVTEQSNDYSVFSRYREYLEAAFPLFHIRAKRTIINENGLIYVISGSDKSLLPACFLAHQDVVPAPSEGWEVPPFSGAIKDGYVYGRGSQDMKGQMIALLEALEILLENGFKPKRSIYCCFGHDEEFSGEQGALKIASYLKEKNVRFEYVIDEGGVVLDGGIIGVDGMLALIGTCEKGYMNVELKAQKEGGHASSPDKRNAVDLLAEAVLKVATSPMKSSWSLPAKQMFKAIAPNMKPLMKFVFVNRDILSPLIKLVLSKASPVTNSLIRTTFAATKLKGSDAVNVLPPSATANINCRININENSQMALRHIRKVVGKDIEVKLLEGHAEPTPVSDISSNAYRTLTRTINEVFENFLPAPYPFIAATDAKHYYRICDNVYRFSPFLISEDDRTRIHAINERANIDGLAKAAQFFARLIENSCS